MTIFISIDRPEGWKLMTVEVQRACACMRIDEQSLAAGPFIMTDTLDYS